jgi:alpha-beta hydrolase superfamily lysophospholipase/SAM-dependent methyltransferase
MKTISPERPIEAREAVFTASDGTPLFYRVWRTDSPPRRGILILHRGHEHSGRLDEVARALATEGTWCFAYDARGHGRSPGRRGDALGAATLVADLDAFARHVCEAHGLAPESLAVVANSVAAVVATAWVHDYAPGIRAIALLAPAFSIKLYVPFALPALRALLRIRPELFIRSYVRPGLLTRDREEARRYAADTLITRDISARVLVELHDLAERILADAPTLDTPTLVVSAGADCVVRAGTQCRFFQRLGATRKEWIACRGMRHALLHERDRERVIADVRRFLDAEFARERRDERGLLVADRAGHTAREWQRLRRPARGPRAMGFFLQRGALRTVGRLSAGIRLGWRHGFDSGRSLDYVYENRARGTGVLGRSLDRAYLHAPGWRGIRRRKELIEETLREILRAANGGPVRIVDVAAGCGRYVLDVIEEFPNASALLCDHAETNVEKGRAEAAARGLERVRFERGDAFDAVHWSRLEPKADVIIVSGLYELFPENAPVLASLRGIVAALKPGGRLIYTGQPWHPQLETIARVLRNREQRRWVMRRRSQPELDALVRAVGLVKERTRIDEQGIFTVSVAAKEDAK